MVGSGEVVVTRYILWREICCSSRKVALDGGERNKNGKPHALRRHATGEMGAVTFRRSQRGKRD